MAITMELNGKPFAKKIDTLDFRMEYDQTIRVLVTVTGTFDKPDEDIYMVAEDAPKSSHKGMPCSIICTNGDEIVRQYEMKEMWVLDYKEVFQDGVGTFTLLLSCNRWAQAEYAGDVLVMSDGCC